MFFSSLTNIWTGKSTFLKSKRNSYFTKTHEIDTFCVTCKCYIERIFFFLDLFCPYFSNILHISQVFAISKLLKRQHGNTHKITNFSPYFFSIKKEQNYKRIFAPLFKTQTSYFFCFLQEQNPAETKLRVDTQEIRHV